MTTTEKTVVPFNLDSIVPFGKYKGQPIAVMRADADYTQWALSQTGITDKYPALIKALTYGTEPEHSCTPEHNKLQMLFLDAGYLDRLFAVLYPFGNESHATVFINHRHEHHPSLIQAHIDKITANVNKAIATKEENDKIRADSNGRNSWSIPELKHDERRIADAGEDLPALKTRMQYATCTTPVVEGVVCNSQFEYRNWDLFVVGKRFIKCPTCNEYDGKVVHKKIVVELKPEISEDYPSILRKVAQRRRDVEPPEGVYLHHGEAFHADVVVITRAFTARSATLEQVKQMYAKSGVRLMLLSEIEPPVVYPEWLTVKGGAA